MKIIYKIKLLIFIFLFLPVKLLLAQKEDDKRMKIELIVKDGKNTTSSALKSFTTSYNRTLVTSEKKTPGKAPNHEEDVVKPFYLSMDFERQDIPILKAFSDNRTGIDVLINVTDTYGKLPSRKFEFKSAVMDIMTDQVVGESTAAYITVGCIGLTIDGVKIDP